MTHERVAIVTGSSRGIGRAIAERLGADGVSVIVNYRSDSAAAAQVVEKIEAEGGRAVAVRADVTAPEQLRQLFDAAEENFGGIDILVNNVGVGRFAPLAQATDDDYDWHFTTNTRATFMALREAANRLRDGGRILVVSTGITTTHRPTAGVYAASKAAAESFALTLAKELGPRHITVNCLLPGVTSGTEEGDGVPEAMVGQILSLTPLGRLGTTNDLADIAGFLISDQGRWITGQTVHAGGGMF